MSPFNYKLTAFLLSMSIVLMSQNAHTKNISEGKNTNTQKNIDKERTKYTKKAGSKKRRAPFVIVDPVREVSYSELIPIIGRFVARRVGIIAAQVNGAIKEFHVDVGDRIEAGAILAVLATGRLKWQYELKASQVANQLAVLKTKQQKIALLRQELGRIQSLKQSPAFSQARLDDKLQQIVVAESGIAEAQAALNTARAGQKLVELDLRDAQVKAPHAGVVTQQHTSVGAYVNVGSPVLTLLDDQTMEIEADVPSNRISSLKKEIEIDGMINEVQRIRAKLRAIIPEENPRTRTRAVRFTPILPKTNGNIIATNQSVVLSLPAGVIRRVNTVHKDALIDRKGEKIVMLVINGRAQPRNIEIGPPIGSRFVIDSGLKAEDLVIVRGNERLLPGTSVRYTVKKTAHKNKSKANTGK